MQNRLALSLSLLALSSVTLMSNVAIVPSLPFIAANLGGEKIDFLSKLLVVLPSLAVVLSGAAVGRFIERFGKKNSAIIALVLFSAFGSTGLYLNSIEWLLISRFLFGIAIAALMIVSTSLVGDYFSGQARQKFLSIQGAAIAFMGVVFVVSGGILCGINWRLPFGVYLSGLLILVLVVFSIKEPPRTSIAQGESVSGRTYLVFLFGFLYMMLFFILPTQMPFLLIDIFKASPQTASFVISSGFLGTAIGSILYVKIKARLSYGATQALGFFIMGANFFAIGFVSNFALFFMTSFVAGFAGGIVMTNITSWLLALTSPQTRVRASSYLSSALFLGQFFSPIFSQWFVVAFGIQRYFRFVGTLVVALVLLAAGAWTLAQRGHNAG